jgi:predicted dehydrogenase
MRQVCLNERQEVLVTEIPAPALSEGQVLVRTGYSLISSGTELSTAAQGTAAPSPMRRRVDLLRKVGASIQREGIASTISRVRQRLQPVPALQGRGYIAAGEVIEVGSGVSDVEVGDRVACAGGTANHAEIIAVPRNLLVRVPSEVPLREACFTTLGAIAMQGLRRAGASFGETVVVIGLGLIGQLTCQLAEAAGCVVIAVDLVGERLKLAKELGAHHVINASVDNTVQSVRYITGDYGADAVLICAATGSSAPVNDAFQMCRERGRAIIVGDVGMNLERSHFYQKELDLLISRSYGPGRYDYEYEQLGIDYPIGYVRWTENRNMAEFVRLLAAGKVRVAPLISAEYALDEAATAYATLSARSREMLGVLFRYESEAKPEQSPSRVVHLKRTASSGSRGRVRFAVIGAGSFARGFHIPSICKMPESELVAIANFTGVNARQAAEEFGASYCTTDYREVLADAGIDAVVITTRHNLHAEMSLAAAHSGKHIFVEKPLALTLEDCRKVSQAVADEGVLLTVGFNRRFAPLALELKALLDNTPGPKMLTYRVNAGWLPPDHWSIDPVQGGGRILGEGCHFFDLLYYLIGSEPVRIAASLARTARESKDPANMSATVEFADGSVGTLVYTVVGDKALPKERVEAFGGGKAFVLNNFDSLESYGTGAANPSTASGDKGHFGVMQHFCDAVLGKTSLQITALDGLRATLCAEKALESARTGKFVDINADELLTPHAS